MSNQHNHSQHNSHHKSPLPAERAVNRRMVAAICLAAWDACCMVLSLNPLLLSSMAWSACRSAANTTSSEESSAPGSTRTTCGPRACCTCAVRDCTCAPSEPRSHSNTCASATKPLLELEGTMPYAASMAAWRSRSMIRPLRGAASAAAAAKAEPGGPGGGEGEGEECGEGEARGDGVARGGGGGGETRGEGDGPGRANRPPPPPPLLLPPPN